MIFIESAQFDLIFWRTDKTISICEIKFTESPIGTNIISEMKEKMKHFPHDKKIRIETILISFSGATESLESSNFFDLIIDGKFLLGL